MSPGKIESEWVQAQQSTIPPELIDAAQGIDLVAQILYRRGLRDAAQIRGFLNPEEYNPASPYDFPGMQTAVDRVKKALLNREKILVWGDFDVDGQTSTSILVSALRHLGGDVEYHIPSREVEGHGIHLETLSGYLHGRFKLIITCDTGISSRDAVEMSSLAGVDVIITDHHEVPDDPPVNAVALINPHYLPADHAMSSLPGCGVAYEFCKALLLDFGDQTYHEKLLDLVALGIVADVAEQRGDTRYLLQLGLRQLRISKRMGLIALFTLVEIEQSSMNEEHIGFSISPRLNALGRLADANMAVDFFLTDDQAKASYYAAELDGLNIQRRSHTNQVLQAAIQLIEDNPAWSDDPILVVGHPDWPGGVLGIVAGNLVELFHKPVILFRINADGLARGSARSVEGIHITNAIKAQHDILNGFGGHPMAAGLSLPAELLPDFRQRIVHTIRQDYSGKLTSSVELDAIIPLSEMDLEFARRLEIMAPFGNGNRAPNLMARNLGLVQVHYFGKSKDHASIQVEDSSGNRIDLNWWKGAGQPLPDTRFDLLYHARPNIYRGSERLQLEWIDFHPSLEAERSASQRESIRIIDYRSISDAADQLSEYQGCTDTIIWAEGSDRKKLNAKDRLELQPADRLVIWSTPPAAEILTSVLAKTKPHEVILFCQDPDIDEVKTMITRLVGILRGFCPAGGSASIARLAAACGHRDGTIKIALHWLDSRGEIQIRKIDQAEVSFDWKQGRTAINVLEYQSRLERSLLEAAAFRNFLTEISLKEWRILLGVDQNKHGQKASVSPV